MHHVEAGNVKNLQGNMLLAVCWNVDFVEVTCQGGHGIAVPNILKLFGRVSQVRKKGKKYCPDSKGIPEKVIEDAFIESYKLMCGDNRDVLDEFIERVEATLSESTIEKSIEKIDREVTAIGHKKKNLLDMRLEDKVDQITYDIKMEELSEKEKKTSYGKAGLLSQAGR